MVTNNYRVLTARRRIENAISHLEFLGFEGIKSEEHLAWIINTTLFELRNARTLLKNTSFKKKY